LLHCKIVIVGKVSLDFPTEANQTGRAWGCERIWEDDMPDFEIHYRDPKGALVDKFSVHCATSMQAKILAHAMKTRPFGEIEVWLGERLVYERPDRRHSHQFGERNVA
jgi:hypothetical protein